MVTEEREIEAEEHELEQPEIDETEQDEVSEPEGEAIDVVSFAGEESEPDPAESEDAAEWVRDTRKQYRKAIRRQRELEAQIEALKGAQPQAQVPQLGPKPTFESCGYDADKLEVEIGEWHEKRAQVEQYQASRNAEIQAEQQRWQARAQSYQAQKQLLKVRDYDEAEDAVASTLSVAQQQVLLQTDQPAPLVYALAKSPSKLKELAAKQDMLEFAIAIGELKGKLQVTKSTAKPKTRPEEPVRGSAATGNADSELKRLRAEAERTGDNTKVVRYMREQRRAKK